MPKPVVSQKAARILAMLLRCGMICREELEIVLEMVDGPGTRSAYRVAGGRP